MDQALRTCTWKLEDLFDLPAMKRLRTRNILFYRKDRLFLSLSFRKWLTFLLPWWKGTTLNRTILHDWCHTRQIWGSLKPLPEGWAYPRIRWWSILTVTGTPLRRQYPCACGNGKISLKRTTRSFLPHSEAAIHGARYTSNGPMTGRMFRKLLNRTGFYNFEYS